MFSKFDRLRRCDALWHLRLQCPPDPGTLVAGQCPPKTNKKIVMYSARFKGANTRT